MKTVDEYMAMLTEPLSAEKVRKVIETILADAQDQIGEAYSNGLSDGDRSE